MPIALSVFANAFATEPVPATIQSLSELHVSEPELVEGVTVENRQRIKDAGEAWAPASYIEGATRGNEGISTLRLIPVDFDRGGDGQSGLTADESASVLEWANHAYEFVAHTTFTSGYYAPRTKWRFIFVADRDMSPDEFRLTWKALVKGCPVPPDETSGEPARLHYTPRIPTEHAALYQSFYRPGGAVPVVSAGLVSGGRLGLNNVAPAKPDAVTKIGLLATTQTKHSTLNDAAFHHGTLGLPRATGWEQAKAALALNPTPVEDWTKAEHTWFTSYDQGVARVAAEQAENKEKAKKFEPTTAQTETAEKRLRAWLKKLKVDAASQLPQAVKELGGYVPHVLSAEYVTKALFKAATQSEGGFVTGSDADRIIAEGLSQAAKLFLDKEDKGEWYELLSKSDKTGLPNNTESNAKIILEKHTETEDVLGLNARSGAPTLLRCPPWCQDEDYPRELIALDGYAASQWLTKMVPTIQLKGRATLELLIAIAETSHFDPVQQWMENLTWDGVPRLDRWLVEYCKTEDNEYNREVGRIFLLGSVHRTCQPGYEFDTVPVFHGAEGIGKSLMLRILCAEDEYFSDTLVAIGDKDSQALLGQCHIIEVAELDRFMRYEAAEMKSYLTGRGIRIRRPYARLETKILPRAVLAGTTNEETYLTSMTGNRRFLPVRVAAELDIDGLKAVKDQLWAEAYARHLTGEKPHLSHEARRIAKIEQESAREEDVLEFAAAKMQGPLDRSLFDQGTFTPSKDQLTTLNALQWVRTEQACEILGVDKTSTSGTRRVGKVLRMQGWKAVVRRVEGINTRVWTPPLPASES